jgi:2-dehydro-3-deoxyphosphooctonate aldolase (KDO 8-P synthase)
MAGPCVVESKTLTEDICGTLKEITQTLDIPFIFKASIEKANRTSIHSFTGLGWDHGLAILEHVRNTFGVRIMTDVHEDTPLEEISSVVDILQTPAFLCRQTHFIQRVAQMQKPMNIKKGQFLAPWDMKHVVEKVRAVGNHQAMVCERGVSFGYNNLIVDMRSLSVLRQTGCPVVFDATHSVQLPGGQGSSTGGQREFIPVLARAAVAAGVQGLFMETHPNPTEALSDGPNSWPLALMKPLLQTLQALDRVVKAESWAEDSLPA